MVYQRDYIMRMIEMIGDLVAGIIGLIRKREFDKASESIKLAFIDMLKEDAAFFNRISVESLTDELLSTHHYTHGHLEILSELYYLQAELSFARGNRDESLEYYRRALKLLEFVEEETGVFSFEKQARLAHLKRQIALLGKGDDHVKKL